MRIHIPQTFDTPYKRRPVLYPALRLHTPKAKNQQRCRRRMGLFQKAYEYVVECYADVSVSRARNSR